LTCGGTTTPVTFRTETAKDPLHAAGVWTILAERSFDAAQECVLTVGDRDPVPVPVTVGADVPLPPDPGFTPSDPPTLRIGDGSFRPARAAAAARARGPAAGARAPVPVPVTAGADVPRPPDRGFTPGDPPTLRIGDGSAPRVAGEWVGSRLAGFDDDELVRIT